MPRSAGGRVLSRAWWRVPAAMSVIPALCDGLVIVTVGGLSPGSLSSCALAEFDPEMRYGGN
jgi:hypothetical protein